MDRGKETNARVRWVNALGKSRVGTLYDDAWCFLVLAWLSITVLVQVSRAGGVSHTWSHQTSVSSNLSCLARLVACNYRHTIGVHASSKKSKKRT